MRASGRRERGESGGGKAGTAVPLRLASTAHDENFAYQTVNSNNFAYKTTHYYASSTAGRERRTPAANVPQRGVAHSRWSCLIGFGTNRDSTAAHRADEREHRSPQGEKRRATLRKVSNPIFCKCKKITKQKEKATTGKFICQAVACSLQGLRNDSWRQTCRCEVSRTPDGRA